MGFIEGFVNGFARAITRRHVEVLCEQWGWTIDGRKGDSFRLDFNDPVLGRRPVYVVDDGEGIIQFTTYSSAFLEPSAVPQEIFGYLVLQNRSLIFAKWISGEAEGEVFFALNYCAVEEGVTGPSFKVICEGMVREAASFDERMKKAGML